METEIRLEPSPANVPYDGDAECANCGLKLAGTGVEFDTGKVAFVHSDCDAALLKPVKDSRENWKAAAIGLSFVAAFVSMVITNTVTENGCRKSPSSCGISVSQTMGSQTIWTPPGFVLAGNAYGKDVSKLSATGYTKEIIESAVEEWQKVLPGRTVMLPNVVLGSCGDEDAIACADTEKNLIHIARESAGWDIKTTIMHEMGHLLGVPHINGDPLMNPSYTGKVEKPTDVDIAIAKLGRHLDITKEHFNGN